MARTLVKVVVEIPVIGDAEAEELRLALMRVLRAFVDASVRVSHEAQAK